MNCVFCEIVAGKKPNEVVLYEDEFVMAFPPIRKDSPEHILVIPKKHISNVMGIMDEDAKTLLHIHLGIQKVAQMVDIAETGFRVITNTGAHGQQEVYHMHYHVIGGRQLTWQM